MWWMVAVNKGGKLSDCWKFITVFLRRKKKEQPWEEYLSKSSVDKKHSFVDSAASLINGFIQKQKTYRKGLG